MKKLTVKQRFKIGEEIMVTFFKPKEGNFPIGRTDNGVIAIIQRGLKGRWEYNSTWKCKISKMADKCVFIIPMTCIESAVEADAKNKSAIERLRDQVNTSQRVIKKTKPSYQYLSNHEQSGNHPNTGKANRNAKSAN